MGRLSQIIDTAMGRPRAAEYVGIFSGREPEIGEFVWDGNGEMYRVTGSEYIGRQNTRFARPQYQVWGVKTVNDR